MLPKRGAFVVFEGCDKAGKTTQVKLLAESLTQKGNRVQLMNFPDRSTAIGGIIDQYLKKQIELTDEAIHLLFSANRWELVPQITKALQEGATILMDRYAFSGIAFSSAKGLDLDWCRIPDVGLPKPDVVIYLNLKSAEASSRGDFGTERYETEPFQAKVKDMFMTLKDDSFWKVVDANRSIEHVHEDCQNIILDAIKHCSHLPIESLWKKRCI